MLRTTILTDLESQRDSLTARIEELRGFEGDYRSGLRSHLESQLATLEATGISGKLVDVDLEPAALVEGS